MGWGSGVQVADDVWDAIKKYIPKAKREEVAKKLIDVFECHDCDNMQDSQLWELAGMEDPYDAEDGGGEED